MPGIFRYTILHSTVVCIIIGVQSATSHGVLEKYDGKLRWVAGDLEHENLSDNMWHGGMFAGVHCLTPATLGSDLVQVMDKACHVISLGSLPNSYTMPMPCFYPKTTVV